MCLLSPDVNNTALLQEQSFIFSTNIHLLLDGVQLHPRITSIHRKYILFSITQYQKMTTWVVFEASYFNLCCRFKDSRPRAVHGALVGRTLLSVVKHHHTNDIHDKQTSKWFYSARRKVNFCKSLIDRRDCSAVPLGKGICKKWICHRAFSPLCKSR